MDTLGLPPPPRMPVTTRIITCLVGNPYKPSFATVAGWGVDPMDTQKDGLEHEFPPTCFGFCVNMIQQYTPCYIP